MSLSTVQKRHQSLLCVVYMQPPAWIFCFDLQLKAIVEAKQEKRMCNEEMWQTENLAKLGKNGSPGATKVHLQLLLL